MGAMNTIDAIRAAEWHLYFPNHRLQGLGPLKPAWTIFYYTKPADANYWVEIDPELKARAAAAHVSQWESLRHKYPPDGAAVKAENQGKRQSAKRKRQK